MDLPIPFLANISKCSQYAGYSGDVWNPQPAPKDHPWRYMPNQAMTPHISGTTIDAQVQYSCIETISDSLQEQNLDFEV